MKEKDGLDEKDGFKEKDRLDEKDGFQEKDRLDKKDGFKEKDKLKKKDGLRKWMNWIRMKIKNIYICAYKFLFYLRIFCQIKRSRFPFSVLLF